MENVVKLVAIERQKLGTGAARELRRKGMVPATVYAAGQAPMSIAIEEKEITKYYRKPQYISQVFELEIGGKSYKVLPKETQLHPITDIVSHVDFMFVDKSIQKMAVPIVYVNKENCIGIKRGGYFNTVRRSLKIMCPVDVLPRKVEIDITSKKIGTTIKASDFELPNGASLMDKPNLVVASIIGKRGRDEDAEDKAAS